MKVNCAGGALFYGRYFKAGWWPNTAARDYGSYQGDLPVLRCLSFIRSRKNSESRRSPGTQQNSAFGQKTGIDLPQEVSGLMPRKSEDPQLQAEMVRGGNYFCWHRTGCGRGHADTIWPGPSAPSQRRPAGATTCDEPPRSSYRCDPGVQPTRRKRGAARSQELGDHH